MMVTQTWIPGITRTFCIEINGTFFPVNSSLVQLQSLDIVTSKENPPYQTDGDTYTIYNESDVITQDGEGLEVTVVTDMRKAASEQSEHLLPGKWDKNRSSSIPYNIKNDILSIRRGQVVEVFCPLNAYAV